MEQENRIGTDGWLRHHMHKSQHGTFPNTYMHNEHTVLVSFTVLHQYDLFAVWRRGARDDPGINAPWKNVIYLVEAYTCSMKISYDLTMRYIN